MSFYILEGRIWFRHYQIVEEEEGNPPTLVEIGPRFILNPIRIFEVSKPLQHFSSLVCLCLVQVSCQLYLFLVSKSQPRLNA